MFRGVMRIIEIAAQIKLGLLRNVFICVQVRTQKLLIGFPSLCRWKDTSNPRVTLCDDGSFCCGTDNATCCDGGFGTKLAKTTTAASAIPLTQLYGDITYNPTTGTATFAEYVDTTTSVSTTASTSTSQSVSSSSASLGVSSTTSSTTAVSKASSGNGSQGNGVAIGMFILGMAFISVRVLTACEIFFNFFFQSNCVFLRC